MSIFRLATAFIFLFGASAQAYQIYNFKPGNLQVSEEQFRRFVRPQVQNIVQEYYSILKKLRPVLGELIEVKQTILALNLDWEDWERKCRVVSYECTVDLRELYKKTRALDQQLLSIQKDRLNLRLAASEADMDAMLYLGQGLGELSTANYLIMHLMEEFLITSNTTYFKIVKSSDKFMPLLHGMLVSSEMMITAQLDKEYKKEFESIWNEFIRPAERYVVLGNSKDYLAKRLEDFNMAWNSFHMRMSMSAVDVPVFAQKLISLMHNRWNGILKTVLASYKEK